MSSKESNKFNSLAELAGLKQEMELSESQNGVDVLESKESRKESDFGGRPRSGFSSSNEIMLDGATGDIPEVNNEEETRLSAEVRESKDTLGKKESEDKINNLKSQLIFIEQKFDKKGDLRKESLPLDLAEKNVKKELDKISRTERRRDLKDFLLDRQPEKGVSSSESNLASERIQKFQEEIKRKENPTPKGGVSKSEKVSESTQYSPKEELVSLIEKTDLDIKRSEEFLKDAQEKGEKDRIGFYKNEVEKLSIKLEKMMKDLQNFSAEKGVGVNLKTLAELGYTREDIKQIRTGEELQKIHKEQIFKEKNVSEVKKDNKAVDQATVEFEVKHGDNGYTKGKMVLDGASNLSITQDGKPAPVNESVNMSVVEKPSNSTVSKITEPVEKPELKTPEVSVNKKEDNAESVYEKNKDKLVSLGWNLEEYLALSKEDRDFVLWNGIKEENYSRNKKETQTLGSVEIKESDLEKEINDFAQHLFGLSKKEGGKDFSTSLSDQEREFWLNNTEKVKKAFKDIFNAEKEKNSKEAILPMPKDVQDFINNKTENITAELKGVSAGAKEFIKQERVLAEEERSVKDLSARLEQGYENLSKDRLIEIAKERGLTSGGDKQVLIERIIKDDIVKGNENFGFTTAEISDKLKEFNISEKQMALISPEFFSLSPEKQRYLISKLEQKIYLDADFASKDKNEEEIKGMGFWKKMRASFVKGQRQVSLRDKVIGEIKSEGLKDYHDDIKTLNAYLSEAPELTYKRNERGRLSPNFSYVEVNESDDKNLQTVKSFFNAAASSFGEIPFEWSLDSATSSQKDKYRIAFASYTSAKNALSKTMLANVEKEYQGVGKAEGDTSEMESKYKEAQMDAMLLIRKADAGVNFGRYITQNPEMEKLTASFAEKVLGTNVGDFARGAAFFGAGYATKWLGRTFAATGVGIVLAGAAGGALAYRKKNLEFTDKELKKRYGNSSEDIKNIDQQIQDKINEIKDSKERKQTDEFLEGLNNNLHALSKQRRELLVKSGIKQDIKSTNVYERLGGLVSQFEKTTDEKSKQRILETIKTRIFVTDQMMQDGRINFGKAQEQTQNQFKLSDLMSKAAILVEMNGGFESGDSKEKTKEEQTFERFKQFIEDDRIQGEKNKIRNVAALKGAAIAAAGFSLGASARWIQQKGYFGAVWDFMKENGAEGMEKLKESISSAGGAAYDYLKGGGGVLGKVKESAGSVGGVIHDYFKGDDGVLESASSSVAETTTNAVENYSVVKEVMAGSRGVIGAIDDLQDGLREKFGANIPPQYEEFMSKKPYVLAQEWGFYKPGEINESAKIMKGEGFSIDSKGVVRLMGLNGTDEVYVPKGVSGVSVVESERSFFDSGRGQENLAGVETEPSINESATSVSDYEAPSRPEQVNEGYVRSSEVKPDTTSWFEKPVPTEFGASNIRGTWNFIEDQNGKITGVNTSRTISDDVINFRKNPRNFMTKNLSSLNMTDSTAVRILTENRPKIEELLVKEHLLNASNSGLNEDQVSFLKGDTARLSEEIKAKTGGVFESKYPKTKAFENPLGIKPTRIVSFDTDAPVKPQVNPSVSSVSEGTDFVPKKDIAVENIPANANTIKIDDLEIIKTSNDVIDTNSGVFKTAVERYGAPKVLGNVSTFGERYIGFYEEGLDQGEIARELNLAKNKNQKILGNIVDQIAVRGEESGKYKVMFIYERINK